MAKLLSKVQKVGKTRLDNKSNNTKSNIIKGKAMFELDSDALSCTCKLKCSR